MENIFLLIDTLISGLTRLGSQPSSYGAIQLLTYLISSSPGLLLFVILPFVGLGIGLIKRIIKLN